MTAPLRTPDRAALGGWRARVWAWVLFAALFKGLIPHAALASVLMQGDPALLWCAPGTPGTAAAGKASDEMAGAEHACVCASAGEATLLPGKPGLLPTDRAQADPQRLIHTAAFTPRLLPPPARGPPAL